MAVFQRFEVTWADHLDDERVVFVSARTASEAWEKAKGMLAANPDFSEIVFAEPAE